MVGEEINYTRRHKPYLLYFFLFFLYFYDFDYEKQKLQYFCKHFYFSKDAVYIRCANKISIAICEINSYEIFFKEKLQVDVVANSCSNPPSEVSTTTSHFAVCNNYRKAKKWPLSCYNIFFPFLM